ncbi:Hypothetical protein A7982_00292 [Minicystis rosea]|nr:Hypothetical protein A7982_00292 [Minicystis rosea]
MRGGLALGRMSIAEAPRRRLGDASFVLTGARDVVRRRRVCWS